ncbi:MAG: DivIVA domain-containing protein [Clostridiales bacterium]|nr:DivIVA domain-containing protein [Clostridiales bacterium]
MLSLIELQNKKVEAKRKKYEKDEMDAYLELIFDNYKQMTEENAKLTEQLRNQERKMQEEREDLNSKIKTLSDGVQYYRSIETTLQKALVLAEKTSKETKDAAIVKAQSIEKAAHLHADKIINNAEEEYQKIREKTMQLIQQFNQYKMQLKKAASAELQLIDGPEFDVQKPEDLDVKMDMEISQENVEDTLADEMTASGENLKEQPKEPEKEMDEAERTAEILSADTIDLRDTLEALKKDEKTEDEKPEDEKPKAKEEEINEQTKEQEESAQVEQEEEYISSEMTPSESETLEEDSKEEEIESKEEEVKEQETHSESVKEATVTPIKPVDVTFTSLNKELEQEKTEKKEQVMEPSTSGKEDLVPTLDSLLQDLNMNNKEKKTDDPFEFLGSVDF